MVGDVFEVEIWRLIVYYLMRYGASRSQANKSTLVSLNLAAKIVAQIVSYSEKFQGPQFSRMSL